jgi:hypothetical protein
MLSLTLYTILGRVIEYNFFFEKLKEIAKLKDPDAYERIFKYF